MASHSLNDVLTAARLFHHTEPGHPPVPRRRAALHGAGTSSIDVNVGVGTTGSSRAHAKMERYLGPKPSCCEFGQFTLKQMERYLGAYHIQCPGIWRGIWEHLSELDSENSNATIFSVQESGIVPAKRYRILMSTMSCASGLHIRSAYSTSYAKTTSPSSTTAPPGPTSPAQLGAETERLIIHALMFCAISTMCTWRHLHVSVR